MNDTTFIYGLIDPRTDEVRYVGKANDPKCRLGNHLTPKNLAPRNKRNSWLKQLLQAGLKPRLVVLEEVDKDIWQEAEQRWIAFYRETVTNMTAGGEGMQDASPELRAAMSERNKGRIAWNKGKPTWGDLRPHPRGMLGKAAPWAQRPMLPHVMEALRAANKGRPTWNKGKAWGSEVRLKLSKRWLVTTPDGNTFEVKNLKQFCKDNGLQDSLMHHVATGKRKTHKGWKCQRIEPERSSLEDT